jgi:hypothetical protein
LLIEWKKLLKIKSCAELSLPLIAYNPAYNWVKSLHLWAARLSLSENHIETYWWRKATKERQIPQIRSEAARYERRRRWR